MITDRQVIEAALPVRVLHWMTDLLERGPDSDPAVFRPIRQLFAEDLGDVLRAEGDPVRQAKLRKRLDRTVNDLMAPFARRELTTPFLAVKYLMDELSAEGLWTIEAGGKFDRAWSALAHALLEHDAEIGERNAAALEGADKSARKNARRMRGALSGMGLYQQRRAAA